MFIGKDVLRQEVKVLRVGFEGSEAEAAAEPGRALSDCVGDHHSNA
jgi:hypothetical protein